MPADLSVDTALRIARACHVAFVVALIAVGTMTGAGTLYYIAVVLSAALLFYEHRLVSPADLSRVNAAFFTVNGVMSIVLFVLVAADTVMRS
jgi:4-hydroxybenzoate polyprenyltransferase